MSDGSGSLEEELELTLGGVWVVVENFPEGFLTSLLHCKFYGLDAAEGIFNQIGVVSVKESSESFGVNGVFGEPVGNWSLVSRDLALGGNFGGHRSVVAAKLDFGFGNLDGGVGSDF